MRRLSHANVVRYLGGEEELTNGRLYIFTEFVSGGSVQSVLQQYGPLPEVRLGYITPHFCSGARTRWRG